MHTYGYTNIPKTNFYPKATHDNNITLTRLVGRWTLQAQTVKQFNSIQTNYKDSTGPHYGDKSYCFFFVAGCSSRCPPLCPRPLAILIQIKSKTTLLKTTFLNKNDPFYKKNSLLNVILPCLVATTVAVLSSYVLWQSLYKLN